MGAQSVRLNGKSYVILEQEEYERLTALAQGAVLPPYPEPDAKGNNPAVEYGQVSIARDVIRERLAAGLSREELAKRAGVRVETLCRVESGKHTPSPRTIGQIDRALKQALSGKGKRK
jgi:DNA-binding XRE family transcriptional regulator